jgi:hypothetical protein
LTIIPTKAPVITRGQVTSVILAIIPADPNRVFAELVNLDAANAIEISPDAAFAYGAGHPVQPGAAFQHRGTVALYARCANTKTANYSLYDQGYNR